MDENEHQDAACFDDHRYANGKPRVVVHVDFTPTTGCAVRSGRDVLAGDKGVCRAAPYGFFDRGWKDGECECQDFLAAFHTLFVGG